MTRAFMGFKDGLLHTNTKLPKGKLPCFYSIHY